MTLTALDLFCGAGGSASGMVHAGVQVVLAANHWDLAVKTHAENHPGTEHDCADISQVDFRRYPATDLLWASPECTNHSGAKGRKRATGQSDLFAPDLGDDAAVRSRATMWDVLRAIEVGQLRGRPYLGGVVENVVEALDWMFWDIWLAGFAKAGYQVQPVFLNSMFARDSRSGAVPAPQSRDRLYVVFWRSDLDRQPDLNVALPAWCPRCEETVAAQQTWKRADRMFGRYRAQYDYRCPRVGCRMVVEPVTRAAAEVIDWSDLGGRIGDRKRPLAPATVARIRAGLVKYSRPTLVPAGGTWNDAPLTVDEPFRTRTTRETEGLACPQMLIPTEARAEHDRTYSAADPIRTQTSRAELAMSCPPFLAPLRSGRPRSSATSEPLATVVANGSNHAFVVPPGEPFMVKLRGGGEKEKAHSVHRPVGTVSAGGEHHGVVIPPDGHLLMAYYGNGTCSPTARPMPTQPTRDRFALIGGPEIAVEDCTFRMLQPREIAGAMAFPETYVVLGSKREQVRQLGNAVTPPAAQLLIRRLADAIEAA